MHRLPESAEMTWLWEKEGGADGVHLKPPQPLGRLTVGNGLQRRCGSGRRTEVGVGVSYNLFSPSDDRLSGGWKIPETCIVEYHCNTKHPGWIQGSHPTVGQGVVQRTVCFTNSVTGCQETQDIKVKNCTDFIVYELKPTYGDNRIYCTDPLSVVTSTSAKPTYNAPTETPSHSEKGEEEQWFQVHVTAKDDMDEDLLREAVQEKLRMMYGDPDLQIAELPEGGQCVRKDDND
ncbi:uromodulin-like [Pristis pectinata]|uniref:uromodulin-like n=1 Tax=Pristis pectinata TaxID=685728 RepID=UPI00223DB92A|nr:uromodulin-like [Pristis pectinata]